MFKEDGSLKEVISNEEYHANSTHLSSSQLKMVLKDPMQYYKKYILKEKQTETNGNHFVLGSVCHLLSLEPHLADSIVEYKGSVRRGAAWELFKGENQGKLILPTADMERVTLMMKSLQDCEPAEIMFHNTLKEHTMVATLNGIPVKARADAINIEQGIIIDLKTTAFASGLDVFKQTVEGLSYDLSAALYSMIAEQLFGRPFDFYFVVLSKTDFGCKIYKTSKSTMLKGISDVHLSLERYKQHTLTNDWSPVILNTDEADNNEIEEV